MRYKKYFMPPVFENEEQTRQGRIVYALAMCMAIGFIPLALFTTLISRDVKAIPMLIAELLSLLSLWLVLHGNIVLPSYILPTMMLPAVTYVIYSGYGLHDENVPGFLVVIALAGLLLGRRGIVVYTALSSVILVLFGLAEIAGLIVNPASFLTVPQTVFAQIIGPLGFA